MSRKRHGGARQGRRVLGVADVVVVVDVVVVDVDVVVAIVVVVVSKCRAPHLEIAHIWYLVIQNGIKIGRRR